MFSLQYRAGLTKVIDKFVSKKSCQTFPQSVEMYGKSNTAHIQFSPEENETSDHERFRKKIFLTKSDETKT